MYPEWAFLKLYVKSSELIYKMQLPWIQKQRPKALVSQEQIWSDLCSKGSDITNSSINKEELYMNVTCVHAVVR